MKRMRSGLCGMIAGAAWTAAILGAMFIGYSWIAPLCGSIAGVMTCAMVYYGKEQTEGKHEFLGHCASCRFWMTTLSPEDRAEAARYENTDGVCDMFNEDGFSPNDYCSRWSARPEDVKRAMEATSSMHEYIEEEARKSREQYAQLTEREPSFLKEEEKTNVCPYNGFEKCRREQCPFWGITQLIFDPSKIPGEQRIDINGCKRVKKELERNNG